jgi:hypothetical protein
VREQLLLDRLRPRDRLGRRAQPLGELLHRLVEARPQRVLGVGAHLGERGLDPAHHLLVDLVLHRPRHPPRRLGGDALADHRLVLGHRARRQPQPRVEQLLVPAPGGEQAQRAADERRHLHAPRARHQPALDELLHVLVAQHLGGAVQAGRHLARHEARLGRVGEEAAEPLPHARPGELGPDHLGRQEVLLHEAAERAPDAVLARRHDGRVRDRDA